MIEIKPFKAYMYNLSKINPPNCLFTPPYDVITKEDQKMFYNLSRYNFIRLILGREYPKDTKDSNRYTRARDTFEKWIRENIIVEASKSAIYIYEQRYKIDGILKKRTGFITLMRLKDFSSRFVFPHEKTFDAPKRDRFLLLKKVKANLSPIFSLFDDPDSKITNILKGYAKRHKKILEVTDRDSVLHRLWQIGDEGVIKKITESMRGKDIYIADGHHRYESALEYKRLMQKKDPAYSKDSPYNFIMVYFLGLNEKAITILPTHRIVKLKTDFNKEKIPQLLNRLFFVERKNSLEDLLDSLKCYQGRTYFFGLCQGKEGNFLLRPKEKIALQVFMKDIPDGLKKIDVELLHTLILDKILKENNALSEISYTRDLKCIQHLTNKKRNVVAFLLNPTRIPQFKTAIRKGVRLPHKSTYFYPKPLSGLVIHKF